MKSTVEVTSPDSSMKIRQSFAANECLSLVLIAGACYGGCPALAQTLPSAHTQRPTHVFTGSATLAGMAVPNGLPTSAWFLWGPRGSVTNLTPAQNLGDGQSVVRVTAPATALTNDWRYQFRLVATNSVGIVEGTIQEFTTGMRVVAWGSGSANQTFVPSNLTNAVALASGWSHGLAIKSDGNLAIWGDHRFHQTNAPPGLTNLMAIACGHFHNLVVRDDGTVIAWGFNDGGQTNVPAGLSNVVAVAAHNHHNLALKSDGTVVAWGYDMHGETEVPVGLSNVVAIAAGLYHSLALRADGSVIGWGNNNYPQPYNPNLNGVTDLAVSESTDLALLSNGTLFSWWRATGPISTPSGLNDITSIGDGVGHFFAIRSNGTVFSWGNSQYGETNVPAGLVAVAAAGGSDHSYALGTRTPTVTSRNLTNLVNRDFVISLQATDPDGDPIAVAVGALPDSGTLYQYLGGSRGSAIITPNTKVTDSQRRVIFAPETNATGRPYAIFGFSATDGFVTSSNATVTLNVLLPSPPAFNLSKCRPRAGGIFELNFSGQSNGTYRVWASTNLVNWEPLGTATVTSNSWFNFLDSNTSNWPRRFYRAGSP